MKGILGYLCFQVTCQGQASYAHVHEIINGLRGQGWEVELFEPRHGKKGRLGFLSKAWRFPEVHLRLWWTISRLRALYVRAHFIALPSVLVAKLYGIPVVNEVNGPHEDLFISYPWTRFLAPLFKFLSRASLRMSDAVITVTPQLRDWVHQEIGPKPVCVIPNGANIDLFRPDALPLDTLVRPYVVFFGALSAWQGIPSLLEALAHPDWPSEVDLVIVGDGAERPRVAAAAAADPRLRYLGPLPYEELPRVVANSLAGLSPKTSLGGRAKTGLSPLKLFETLACGVPAIVTDFPGQADLVREHQCGIILPPEDPVALAKAVRFVYENPVFRRKCGSRGRRALERDHCWRRRAEATAEVLEGI